MFFFGCTGPYTLGQCLRECLRMPTRMGKGAYARGFLYHMPTRVPPQGSLFDGHVRSK